MVWAMARYRSAARKCPGCGEVLEERKLGDALIDVCPACHGLWLDWLDGDVPALTAQMSKLPRAQQSGGGTSECPACAAPLSSDTLTDGGAEVWRCGECAGTFVPREAVDAIAAARRGPAQAASTDPWLTRLLDTVGRWMGG